jgi:hypothetical protein
MATRRARQTHARAASAILAAAVACFVFGLLTVVEHTVDPGRQTLTFYAPVGWHSGTTAVAVVIWITLWCFLHGRWRRAELPFVPIFAAALALIALGSFGTFPPIYQAIGVFLKLTFGTQLPWRL